MDKELLNIFENLQFHINEANYSRIDNIWKEIVAFYPYNRLYLLTQGSALLYLKDKIVRLEPNHLYFIPQHTVLRGECDSFEHYYCHFEISAPFSDILKFINFSQQVVATETDHALFQQLIDNRPFKTPSQFLAAQGSFRLLFSRFLNETTFADQKKIKFLPVLKFIDENYAKLFTLDDLASLLFFNTQYFCSQFTKVFGISPWQYVISIRLNKSIILLDNSNRSIKEISTLVGFSDEYYFSRLFKKKFGISPKQHQTRLKSHIKR
jgi:AraC-like DNA-binding protein